MCRLTAVEHPLSAWPNLWPEARAHQVEPSYAVVFDCGERVLRHHLRAVAAVNSQPPREMESVGHDFRLRIDDLELFGGTEPGLKPGSARLGPAGLAESARHERMKGRVSAEAVGNRGEIAARKRREESIGDRTRLE